MCINCIIKLLLNISRIYMVNTLSPGSDLTLRIPSVTEVYLQYIFLILPLATGFELLRAVPDLICHLFLLLVIFYVYNQLKYIIIIFKWRISIAYHLYHYDLPSIGSSRIDRFFLSQTVPEVTPSVMQQRVDVDNVEVVIVVL